MVAKGGACLGAAVFLIGGFLYCAHAKWVIERANQLGVAQFSGFRAKLGAEARDKLIFRIAITLLFSGLLTLACTYEVASGSIVLWPIHVFMLFLAAGA